MSSRWTRVVRGTLAASFSTFAAAFSHAISGGNAPSVAALSLALAFSTITCIALAGRGLSYWRLGASVAASQVFFHTLFSMIQTPVSQAGGSAATVGGAAHAGHDMATMFVPTGDVAAITVSVAMIAGHVMAAVATFAAIAWAERSARGLLATAALRLTTLASLLLPTPLVAPRPARLGRVLRIEPRPTLRRLAASLQHRGPPLVAF
ncbi:hypothetical protein [Agreia sp. COWG]|uniref:hypothetical protein n=1 Tax=Agreia sp. COWG TaxID=2773266 RepID=UPI001925BF48|nr:hypothetical protein [Agreia sp. COWG]CAD5990469.1 conserved membrane protein of unknown function [Agreia sp. COWG]